MYRGCAPRKLQRRRTIDGSVVLTAPFLRSLVLGTLAPKVLSSSRHAGFRRLERAASRLLAGSKEQSWCRQGLNGTPWKR